MGVRGRVKVKIDMSVQLLALQVFMSSTAHIFRIVEHVGNAGNARDESEKLRVLHQPVKAYISGPEPGQIRKDRLPRNLSHLGEPLLSTEERKLRHQFDAEPRL